MTATRIKDGRGQFQLQVQDNGTTHVSVHSDGRNSRVFASPRDAYDYYRPVTTESHTFWNICYHLEEFL